MAAIRVTVLARRLELSARDAASQLCWQVGAYRRRGWRGQTLRAGRDVCSICEQTELRIHLSGVVWASAPARRSTRPFAYDRRLSWSALSCRLVGRMPEQHAARARGACRTAVPTVVRPSPRERPAEDPPAVPDRGGELLRTTGSSAGPRYWADDPRPGESAAGSSSSLRAHRLDQASAGWRLARRSSPVAVNS